MNTGPARVRARKAAHMRVRRSAVDRCLHERLLQATPPQCSHAERSTLQAPPQHLLYAPYRYKCCLIASCNTFLIRSCEAHLFFLHATKLGGATAVIIIHLKMEALLNVWYERFEAIKASIDHSIENGGEWKLKSCNTTSSYIGFLAIYIANNN